MAKTKRRMFATPSAAAVSAATRIKSNLSTVTKLPTALKRSNTNPTNAENEDMDYGLACTVPSASSSTSAESSVNREEAKAGPRMFKIPSLKSIRTLSKDKIPTSDCSLDSPKAQIKRSTSNSSGTITNSEEEAKSNDDPETQKSAVNSASRFVRGMPTLLRRAVSNTYIPDVSTQKKSPGITTNSISQREFMDDGPENDRQSLLFMLQVPQTRRHSQVPLMAASETW